MSDALLTPVELTIQLCTYKRPRLLARVLEACFDQTVAPERYEVVVVNDGSPDETPEVLERMRSLARCGFTVVHQRNAGLARARNAGLAKAAGTRIAFIDDDVLPTPVFVEEHLRSDAQHGDVIVRGGVVNADDPDHLPPPVWTPANYSANYFWTTNVSVRRARLDLAGGRFDESFTEYGWEDIELGMRLRKLGTRSVFNKFAIAFHIKPAARAADIPGALRQVQAQARTALQLERKHPHWRVALAIGDTAPQRWLGDALVRSGIARRLERTLAHAPADRPLTAAQRAAVGLVAADAYYAELSRARGARS